MAWMGSHVTHVQPSLNYLRHGCITRSSLTTHKTKINEQINQCTRSYGNCVVIFLKSSAYMHWYMTRFVLKNGHHMTCVIIFIFICVEYRQHSRFSHEPFLTRFGEREREWERESLCLDLLRLETIVCYSHLLSILYDSLSNPTTRIIGGVGSASQQGHLP